VDAVCFQMDDRALEIASFDHKDVGSGGGDRREVPDRQAMTVLSPPGVDDALGSDDNV
jgi:hypothetical protein